MLTDYGVHILKLAEGLENKRMSRLLQNHGVVLSRTTPAPTPPHVSILATRNQSAKHAAQNLSYALSRGSISKETSTVQCSEDISINFDTGTSLLEQSGLPSSNVSCLLQYEV